MDTFDKWHNDGHTVEAKYSDRNCGVVMVINCPRNSRVPIGCDGSLCHVRQYAQEYGWEVFGGFGDFDLKGDPKPIEWYYPAPEEIALRVIGA